MTTRLPGPDRGVGPAFDVWILPSQITRGDSYENENAMLKKYLVKRMASDPDDLFYDWVQDVEMHRMECSSNYWSASPKESLAKAERKRQEIITYLETQLAQAKAWKFTVEEN